MAGVEKQAVVKAAHQSASKVLANFISASSGLSDAQIEAALGVVSQNGAGEPGSFWQRTRASTNPREQNALARWAHRAVELGWLKPCHIPELLVVPGGRRAIQPVLRLLLRMHRGDVVEARDIEANLRAWRDAYDLSEHEPTGERNRIKRHAKLTAAALVKAATRLEDLTSELTRAESYLVDLDATAPHADTSFDAAARLVRLHLELTGASSVAADAGLCPPADAPDDPDFDPVVAELQDIQEAVLACAQRINKLLLKDSPYVGLGDLPEDDLSQEDEVAIEQLFLDWYADIRSK